jgi:leucyl-tRNA synthetase
MHREFGVRLVVVAEKMSKSRGNVVNPDAIVEEFGADSLRLYEMFMGPLEQSKPWQTSAIQGVRRFLDRVHGLAMRDLSPETTADETARLVHRTIKKVGEDIEALRLNTAISSMMILSNHLSSIKQPPRDAVERLVLCLSPFAPHIAEEIWSSLGHGASIAQSPWPDYDPSLCEDALVEMAVQVNGKVRGRVTIAKDAETKVVETAALADAGVQRFIGERSVKKTIYVPGKILNIIIE